MSAKPICLCPPASEYDPPCPEHGVVGLGCLPPRDAAPGQRESIWPKDPDNLDGPWFCSRCGADVANPAEHDRAHAPLALTEIEERLIRAWRSGEPLGFLVSRAVRNGVLEKRAVGTILEQRSDGQLVDEIEAYAALRKRRPQREEPTK